MSGLEERKLDYLQNAFARVGWFIPPYISLGFLSGIAAQISASDGKFDQDELEAALGPIYNEIGLATLITERYSTVSVLSEYRKTIQESAEAHFLGLDHIAVGGLAPVVEGAGRRLVGLRGLKSKSIKDVFIVLAEHCKTEVMSRQLGAVGEVISMLDSFSSYATEFFYADSDAYSLVDRTNRHGIAHGRYTDDDYGRPLNFYKTITAINFLAFISSFWAGGSWLWPPTTDRSLALANYFATLKRASGIRPI